MMDPNTGRLYTPEEAAHLDEVSRAALVALTGQPEQIRSISAAVKAQRRNKAKAARKARRRSR